MIDTIISILGYSGSDPVVTYIVAASGSVLCVCLVYKFSEFIFGLITCLLSRGKPDIKF